MRLLALIPMSVVSLLSLAGCPGDPIEGTGSGSATDDGSSSGASATLTATSASTLTQGSQSASEDSGTSVSATVDDTGDPTSATLEGTDSIADTGTTETSTASATATESTGDATTTDTGACVEADEPNDDEVSATDLGDVVCNGGATVAMSIADAATTPDWFTFFAAHDEAACGEAGLPSVVVTAGGPLSICAFADCLGNTETALCDAGVAAVSTSGLPGCCGSDEVRLDVDCPGGGNESAAVHVQVDTAGSACGEYTLELES